MKKIIAIISMIMMSTLYADASKVPSYLKDAVITVKLKNGKEYTFSANTHAVVARDSSNSLKPAQVITVEKETVVEKAVYLECKAPNRLRVFAGRGPSGVRVDRNVDSIKVKSDMKAVGGVGYDRMIDEQVSVGAQLMSNGTATLGLGVDF